MPFRLAAVCLTVLAGAASLFAATATPARAGTYEYYFCKAPGGGVGGAEGWSLLANLTSDFHTGIAGCPGGNMRVAAKPQSYAANTWMGLQFKAPPATSIARYSLVTDGRVMFANGGPWNFTLYNDRLDFPATVRGQCWSTDGCGDIEPVGWSAGTEPNIGAIYLLIDCSAAGGPGSPCDGGQGPYLQLGEGSVTLQDDTRPTIPNASGSLVSQGAVLSGVARANFTAEDVGGGAHSAVLAIDGRDVGPAPLDVPASCRAPYLEPVPCPAQAAGTAQVDTRTLTDGEHEVTLRVGDAAGNVGFYGPVTVKVDNTPDPVPPPQPTPSPPPSPSPAPLSPTESRFVYRARYADRRLRVLQLLVRPAPAGGRVEIRCSGLGCPVRKRIFSIKSASRQRSLTGIVRRGRGLRAGARLRVELTVPGKIGKVLTLSMNRRGRPSESVRCLVPGRQRTVAC